MAGRFNPENYETVKERKLRFGKMYPDYAVHLDLVSPAELAFTEGVMMKAHLWKDRADMQKGLPPDSEGHSLSLKGGSGADATSWTENCEESAIGRALDNIGFLGDRLTCSREEIVQAEHNRAAQSAYLPPTDAEQEAMEDLLKMDDKELRDLAVGMAQEVKDKMTIDLRKVCMSKVVSISQMKLPLAKDVRPGLALIVLRANAMLKTTKDEAA